MHYNSCICCLFRFTLLWWTRLTEWTLFLMTLKLRSWSYLSRARRNCIYINSSCRKIKHVERKWCLLLHEVPNELIMFRYLYGCSLAANPSARNPGPSMISGLNLVWFHILAPRVFLWAVRFSSFHNAQHSVQILMRYLDTNTYNGLIRALLSFVVHSWRVWVAKV